MIIFQIRDQFTVVAASPNSEYFNFIIRNEEYTLTKEQMRNFKEAINLLELKEKKMKTLEFKETQGGDNVIVEASNNIIVFVINPEKENYDLPLNDEEALKLANFILENVK